jgi:hypothetical protein
MLDKGLHLVKQHSAQHVCEAIHREKPLRHYEHQRPDPESLDRYYFPVTGFL